MADTNPNTERLRTLCGLSQTLTEQGYALFRGRGFCTLVVPPLVKLLNETGEYKARPVEAYALVHNEARDAHLLGHPADFEADGIRAGEIDRSALPPDDESKLRWGGHLVALVDDAFLLDPTLDQVNDACPFFSGVEPGVFELGAGEEPGFLAGRERLSFHAGPGLTVIYKLFPERRGWLKADWFPGSKLLYERVFALISAGPSAA
jgi:hypothetical protein